MSVATRTDKPPRRRPADSYTPGRPLVSLLKPIPSWAGARYAPRSEFPPAGQHVVYVLWDAADVVIYVGQSANFLARYREHRANALRDVHTWAACPAPTRRAALALERLLITQLHPTRNLRGF